MTSKIHRWDDSGYKTLTEDGKIAFNEACCCECPSYADDFGRSDSTDLGADWTEVSGSWEIKSNQLYETGNAGAIALYDKLVRTNYMEAVIDIMNEAMGGIYKLYIAWADSNNYLMATYTRLVYDAGTNPGSDMATLSIHSVIGGSSTLLDSLTFQLAQPSLSPRGFNICMDATILEASVEDSVLCHVFTDPVEITDGYQGAVGHGNSSEVYFDNWVLVESTSEQYDACPPCWECGCGGKLPPRKLVATYYGDGLCDTLDGITCDLDLTQCGADALAVYTGTINCSSCIDGVILILKCGAINEAATAWQLTINENGAPGGLGCAEGTYTDEFASASSTCDPFSLDFPVGPGDVLTQLCPEACYPCGEPGGADPPYPQLHYHIVITERP